MQCVILAGGKGERMRPYTEKMPKPMFLIGEKPVLWHIMKYYSCFGVTHFTLCLGYKGDKIQEYFENNNEENWKIDFVNTGIETNKGGRLLAVKDYIKTDDFYLAYGDDLSNVNIKELTNFHKEKKTIVTLTATPLKSNFGVIELDKNNLVTDFKEKPRLDHWINGGFFVINKKIFNHLKDGMDLETDTFKELALKNQISAFKHDGFWNAMNTHKDTQEIVKMWESNNRPWVCW